MDAITDFLSAVRVQGVCFGRIQITTPWAPRSETGLHAGFGLISYGQARLHLPDVAEPLHLSHGDFFLLAPGREYLLSTSGGGAPSAIIAGRFSFDDTHGKPLTDFLPPIILIRGGQPHMLALQKTLELLASEVEASKLMWEVQFGARRGNRCSQAGGSAADSGVACAHRQYRE